MIHTNLGRSLLAEEAIAAVADAMRSYAALEYDIASGGRGDRDYIVEDLLRELTGAEAATVVNNNAAAVLLSLKALATRKEAIISRGELIEIGGAFRMPDIMKAAGCKLVEVGTTNRTHARDYEEACGPKTGLIVKAHWSNYAITGFTATVDDATLAQIAHARGVPYMVDLGSGALIDLALHGLPQGAAAAGVARRRRRRRDVLGRQAARWAAGGIDRRPRRRDRENQERPAETRAARLEADDGGARGDAAHLRERSSARRAVADARAADAHGSRNPLRRASELRRAESAVAPAFFEVASKTAPARSASGSMPAERLPSAALVPCVQAGKVSGRAIERLQERLRALPTPVIGRIADGALWLDLRCLWPRDEAAFAEQL